MSEVSKLNSAQSNIEPVTIKIRRGQGITNALFELVKNEILSGGTIDKKEWADTLQVLNEIQASRQKNGEKEIFSTAPNGQQYVVHENDVIEFSSEEIKKLYNAMGVTLKNSQSQASDDINTSPNYETTDIEGVFCDKETNTYYKIENGKHVEFKGKNGGKVIYISKDGSYLEKFPADENGNYKTQEINKKGQVEWVSTNDKKDRVLKRTFYKNGKPTDTYTRTYNKNGAYTEEHFAHMTGQKTKDINYYDEFGNNISKEKYDKIDLINTTNTKNYTKTALTDVFYNKENNTYYKIENGKYIEFKGKNGGEVIYISKDGSYQERFPADESGNYKTQEINKEGQVEWVSTSDKKNRTIKTTLYKNGKQFCTYSYLYNNDGSYIEKMFMHNSGWKHNNIKYLTKNHKEIGGVLEDGTTKWINKYLSDGSYISEFNPKNGKKYYKKMDKNGYFQYNCDANGKRIDK